MFSKTLKTFFYNDSKIDYTIIPWDSEYLDNTTVEIESFSLTKANASESFREFQKKLNLKKGDLLFTKLSLEDIEKTHVLFKTGFYWIEQTITLKIDLSSWEPDDFIFEKDNEYRLVPAKNSDKAAIKKIAKKTFTADRYHLDPHINKSKANHRFEMWIENSFKGSDTVYKFIDKNNMLAGFFIINDEHEVVELRLAGLDPTYIGKGVGKMLYHHMYQLLKEKKHKVAEAVISFNNIAVLNVYLYLGKAKCIKPLIALHKVI